MRLPNAPKEQLTAPAAKFRVLSVDVHDPSGAVYLVGDFDSLPQAKETAKQNSGTGRPIFVYDDRAQLIVRYGSWH
jgi:hypothetical protein